MAATTKTKKATKKTATKKLPPLPTLYFDGLSEWDAETGYFVMDLAEAGTGRKFRVRIGPCCDDLDQFENMAADLRPIIEALENGNEEDAEAVRKQIREEAKRWEEE